MYHSETANAACNQFVRLINTLRKEEKETKGAEKCPWLDDSDERKYISDRNCRQVHRLGKFMSDQIGKRKK